MSLLLSKQNVIREIKCTQKKSFKKEITLGYNVPKKKKLIEEKQKIWNVLTKYLNNEDKKMIDFPSVLIYGVSSGQTNKPIG